MLDGRFKLNATTPVGNQSGFMTMKTEDGALTGTMEMLGSTFDIENGTYYMLVPCVFLKGATTAPMAHYDYARVDDKYSWRLPVVCHWPLLSNGNEWPSGIEYYFVEGEDGKPGHWEKTIPD